MILPQSNLWAAYVAKFGRGMTQAEVGELAGVDQATVGRWLRGAKAPTEAATVAAVAQGFRRNPLEAFVAAGFLTVDEAGRGLEDESRELLARMRDQVESDRLGRRIAEVAIAEIRARQERGEIVGDETLREIYREVQRNLGITDEALYPHAAPERYKNVEDAIRALNDDAPKSGKHRRGRRPSWPSRLDQAAALKPGAGSSVDRRRQQQDEVGEQPDPEGPEGGA